MRDIACAANGSDQTLCNYFSSKEHLIFDQQQEFEERILRAAIGTSSGMPLSETLRQGASRLLHDLSKNVGKVNGIPGEAATGPELRRVWIERNARHADRLPDALLETGWTRDRPTARFVARSTLALFAVVFEGSEEAVISRKSRGAVGRELSCAINSIAALIQ